jgi:DNA replication protein DnaC
MIETELLKCCKRLKLSRNIVDNCHFIKNERFQEDLLELFKMEIAGREKAKREKLIKSAGFYTLKHYSDFIYDEVQVPSSITTEYLKNTQFIDETKNLILYGNVGTGKTHLSIALGIEACKRGLTVGFYRTASLVNLLSESKKSGKINKLLTSLKNLDLLICDEWGYVPLDKEAAQLLFQVVSDRYENGSIIITTNLEFSRWVGIFYDEQMTAALIDRLVHHSYLLMFTGPSNRIRDSLMRTGEDHFSPPKTGEKHLQL